MDGAAFTARQLGSSMRRIRVLTYPNAELLDVAGPIEVFAITSECALMLGAPEAPCYEVELISLTGGPVMTSAGVAMTSQPADVRDVDTLLIPGAHGSNLPRHQVALLDWIVAQSARAKRIGSIGTGSIILAQTGLLSGRRVTTHWAYAKEMALEFPDTCVVAGAVNVVDEPIWTSGGVLASVDMALAMVEADLGTRMADYVARRMVAKARRLPGEAQISAQILAQEPEIGRLRKLMEWIAENPTADLSVEALAERAALSRRCLERRFKRETRLTPAEFVERTRIDEARRLLARTDNTLERVAAAAGFNSLSTMRRAFIRALGITPSEYRRTFGRQANLAAR